MPGSHGDSTRGENAPAPPSARAADPWPRLSFSAPTDPEPANPYAPPEAELGEPVEAGSVPPSFLGKFAMALRLLTGDLPMLSALVLTVWLPGNLAVETIAANHPQPDDPWAILRLSNLIEAFFGPIYIGGALSVLANRMIGQKTTYLEAIRVGLHSWGRLFGARFVAGLFIILGLVAFIVPGIILAIRYCLIDPVVVLEGEGVSSSRQRSTELVRGKGLEIIMGVFLYLLIMVALSAVLEQIPEFGEPWINFGVAVVRDCVSDVAALLMTCFLFLYFWEGHLKDRQRPEAGLDKPAPIDEEL
jgi:hypothetical protein